MLEFPAEYRSPPHAVERVRVRLRVTRSRPDYAVLYGLAAAAGMVTGFVLTRLA